MLIVQLKALMLLAFLLIGREKVDEIERVKIAYLPEYSCFNVPVTCSSLEWVSGFNKEKIADDRRFTRLISDELKKLKPKEGRQYPDFRIKLMIKYQDRVDTLCMGEFFDVTLNGQAMEDSPELLAIVKRRIY
ncbi:hypothetical protein J0A68_11400 [Algoriphagus sp. H41]|uniref:DUF4377 domain-containing protein n=1 Tax=Algoriphagus oliviformis TaxID=2811231 RepID=A0ABS3C4M9_9BACT|nr:hypothetical protein [Algoriphagus oliviformis]MBN7811559.1 hypothetical protein [Algoriphagus oliviformis]